MISVVSHLLIVVEVIVSLLLVGIILLQKTKSQGMGLAFGSGMGESLFGAQVGNVLTKATVVLAVIFLVNTTLLAMIGTGRPAESVTDSIATEAPVATPSAMPEIPAELPPVLDMEDLPMTVAPDASASGRVADEPVAAEPVAQPAPAESEPAPPAPPEPAGEP